MNKRSKTRGLQTLCPALAFACFALVVPSAAFTQVSRSQPQQTPVPTPPSAPQDPESKKDSSPNPAEAAAEKTKQVTVEAAKVSKQLGKDTLVRMRDWEYSWLTGPYAGRQRPLQPLTAKQRWDIYLQQTLTTPGAYAKRMFVAGIDQARGAPSQWHGGWEGYGKRFASREGQFVAANSIAASGNAALGLEPLYDECQCRGFGSRLRHALVRNFLTYDRKEKDLRPQWGLYGGAFAGGVIASTWKPHPRNAWADGGYAMLGQAGYGALLNFFIEFAGEINRKLGAKH
jgi:hypothetical protein